MNFVVGRKAPQQNSSPDLVGLSSCQANARSTIALRGAGATLPAPLYTTWFNQYEFETDGVDIRYEAVGSGNSIQQFY